MKKIYHNYKPIFNTISSITSKCMKNGVSYEYNHELMEFKCIGFIVNLKHYGSIEELKDIVKKLDEL